MKFVRQHRTILAYLTLFCLLALSSALADDSNISKDALRKGSWSLQFGVGSDFTLHNFLNASVAGKYQWSTRSGLQVGISPGYSRTVSRGPYASAPDRRSSSITMAAHYVYYIKPPKRLNGYIAGGPEYSFYRDRDSFSYTSYKDVWFLGAVFRIGAEWFATKEISIFAEYSLALDYGKETVVQNNLKNSEIETSSFGARAVVLGISLYL